MRGISKTLALFMAIMGALGLLIGQRGKRLLHGILRRHDGVRCGLAAYHTHAILIAGCAGIGVCGSVKAQLTKRKRMKDNDETENHER